MAGNRWRGKTFRLIISKNYIDGLRNRFSSGFSGFTWPPHTSEEKESNNIRYLFENLFGMELREANPQAEDILLDVKKERSKRTGEYFHRLYIKFTTRKTYGDKFDLSPIVPYVRR